MMEYVGVHIVFKSKQKPTRRRNTLSKITEKIRIYYLKPNISHAYHMTCNRYAIPLANCKIGKSLCSMGRSNIMDCKIPMWLCV